MNSPLISFLRLNTKVLRGTVILCFSLTMTVIASWPTSPDPHTTWRHS
jgi:hypothetical protein